MHLKILLEQELRIQKRHLHLQLNTVMFQKHLVMQIIQ